VDALLAQVGSRDRRQVVDAMGTIERLLGAPAAAAERAAPYLLRHHQPGDMGWVIHRHGAIYARDWGYNQAFEALVARICADFLDRFDPSGERCWIAERHGEIVGSVFSGSRRRSPSCGCRGAEARGLGTPPVRRRVSVRAQAGYRRLTL
jgi:hypothetical protein